MSYDMARHYDGKHTHTKMLNLGGRNDPPAKRALVYTRTRTACENDEFPITATKPTASVYTNNNSIHHFETGRNP